MKILEFENMLNMRDIGGYKGEGGKTTRFDTIIRCDAPKEMNEDEINYLLSRKINTEIDLRTDEVIEHYPSSLGSDSRFNYYHYGMKFGSQASLYQYGVQELYRLITECFDITSKIFKTIAHSEHGVIINCTAGKDRTGIVIAILLKLCGVSEEDIVNDYAISATLIDKNIPHYRLTHPQFPESLGVSNREDIEFFLKYFKDTYGNAYNYLIKIGLTDEEINNIKNKILN